MPRLFSPPPFAMSSAFLLAFSVGCSGHHGSSLENATVAKGTVQSFGDGAVTTRVVGTAQPPVTAAASGVAVTGIAGALVSNMTAADTSPTSLSDTKIVFQNDRTGFYRIYLMSPDGSHIEQVTNGDGRDSDPRISPDGNWIAFDSIRDGNREIYKVRITDGTVVRLTADTIDVRDDISPSWSPDGQYIVYLREELPHLFDIIRMKADGSEKTNLTNTPGLRENFPVYSPDGSRILFTRTDKTDVSDTTVPVNLFTMNTNGGDIRQLTFTNFRDEQPAYSPDGNKIAFHRRGVPNNEKSDIIIINADGSHAQDVTNTTDIYEEFPQWSPDGKKIVFRSNRDTDTYEIYTINPDGSGLTRLTDNGSGDFNGNWSNYLTRAPLNLVGAGGLFGTSAAGFLFGQQDRKITGIVAFDTAAATRSNVRITAPAQTGFSPPNLAFIVTASDALTNLKYINGMDGTATTVIGTGGATTSASGAVVSFSGVDGAVTAVFPYNANRAAHPERTSDGASITFHGHFLAAYDGKGKNQAINGASSVRIDAKTGALLSAR